MTVWEMVGFNRGTFKMTCYIPAHNTAPTGVEETKREFLCD